MKASHILVAVLSSATMSLVTPSFGQSQWVFVADFDHGAPKELSGFTTKLRGVEGLAGVGSAVSKFSGKLLQNDSGYETGDRPPKPTTFTLTNLPQHTSVDLNFLLAILNTWDADPFAVRVDGKTVFTDLFAFDGPHSRPLYEAPVGGLLTPPPTHDHGQPSPRPIYPDLGFDNSWGDQAYDMSVEPRLHGIAHTADILTIQLLVDENGWEGGTNESFGIDNFEVRLGGRRPGAVVAGAHRLGDVDDAAPPASKISIRHARRLAHPRL